MTWYWIWNELEFETLTPDQKDLLGVRLSEFPPMTLDHLSKRIKKIGTSYLWSIPPNAVLRGLVSYALLGYVALVFSLWHIRWLHRYIQAIMQKHRLPMSTAERTMKDMSFPAQFRPPKSMPHCKCLLGCSITNLSSVPNQVVLQGLWHHVPWLTSLCI